ncbi:hypothetical protein ONZ45_g15333 [Pleurotus djamor]|nr:hypothetical protein ONZ45_g15333 [Pleurotus djamor]
MPPILESGRLPSADMEITGKSQCVEPYIFETASGSRVESLFPLIPTSANAIPLSRMMSLHNRREASISDEPPQRYHIKLLAGSFSGNPPCPSPIPIESQVDGQFLSIAFTAPPPADTADQGNIVDWFATKRLYLKRPYLGYDTSNASRFMITIQQLLEAVDSAGNGRPLSLELPDIPPYTPWREECFPHVLSGLAWSSEYQKGDPLQCLSLLPLLEEKSLKWDVLCLEKGEALLFHPNTAFISYSIDPAVYTMEYLYDYRTLQGSLVGIIWSFLHPVAIVPRMVNWIHPVLEVFTRALMALYDVYRDESSVAQDVWNVLPSLRTRDGVEWVVTLCIIGRLLYGMNPGTACNCGAFALKVVETIHDIVDLRRSDGTPLNFTNDVYRLYLGRLLANMKRLSVRNGTEETISKLASWIPEALVLQENSGEAVLGDFDVHLDESWTVQ